MSRTGFTDRRPRPPIPHTDATEALWQYLRRIESGLDQIDARIDRLYVALGGGTVLLATIGLVSAFIVRGG
ncbi:MAG: hypothetical protein OXS30_11310 [Chloroflexota bacterium]|nr:hypothetical protein [Chloroflexota bacterium]